MKSRILLGMVGLFVLCSFSALFAQQDPIDPGVADTVRIGCPIEVPTIVEGDSFAIPVYFWNDETFGGFSVGFEYSSDFVEITSIDFTGSILNLTQQAFVNQKYVPAQNQVLVGWAPFSPSFYATPSAGSQGDLFFSLNMKILTGASNETIDIDSTFVAPAGDFLMSVDTSSAPPAVFTMIKPMYSDCGTGDVFLGGSAVFEFEGPTLPESFSLKQNVPNPFNPNTAIDFAIPRSSQVTIEVYNSIGQKVTTLVDEYMEAGFKRVEWDGTNAAGASVSSGVYFYKMTAGDFTASKKMMLLK